MARSIGTTNEAYLTLLSKPACTLSALEQYMVTRYCDEHPDEVREMFASAYPGSTPLRLTPAESGTSSSCVDGLPKVVYGLKGICEIFHCKNTKAQAIKNSGVIDAAISQMGRKFAINVEKALALASADPRVAKTAWRM